MTRIEIVPVGSVEDELLRLTADAVAFELATEVSISPQQLDPAPFFDRQRQQYGSSRIVEALARRAPPEVRLLGVTAVDLFVPILKYVFGEAEVGGRAAVVSAWRLRQELYGLQPDEALLADRLAKEAVHELGHTFGLGHCDDYGCVMASAHSVEWIDLRGESFCPRCREKVWRPTVSAMRAPAKS